MTIDDFDVCIPVVSAIIERNRDGETEILVQTRWMPERDPQYSGTLEIAAGWIDRYENVFDALRREVSEETGLKVTKIFPEVKTKEYSPNNDRSFAFQSFCCQQQLEGGKPWIGFVFVCEVEDEKPIAQHDECRDIRWMKRSELKSLLENEPQKIFTLQLGALDYYVNNR